MPHNILQEAPHSALLTPNSFASSITATNKVDIIQSSSERWVGSFDERERKREALHAHEEACLIKKHEEIYWPKSTRLQCIPQTFSNGRYVVVRKLGWGHFSTVSYSFSFNAAMSSPLSSIPTGTRLQPYLSMRPRPPASQKISILLLPHAIQ